MFRTILVAALPLLTACASPTPLEPEAALTRWTFVSIDGQPPRSDRSELAVYESRISATVGCNGMGGELKLEPGRLIVGPVVSTQMYCEGLMDQEHAVAELLGASPGFFIEGGRMGIVSDKHRAELVRKDD